MEIMDTLYNKACYLERVLDENAPVSKYVAGAAVTAIALTALLGGVYVAARATTAIMDIISLPLTALTGLSIVRLDAAIFNAIALPIAKVTLVAAAVATAAFIVILPIELTIRHLILASK